MYRSITKSSIFQISHLYYLTELQLEGLSIIDSDCCKILENIKNLKILNISWCTNLTGKDIENLLMSSDNIIILKMDNCQGLTTDSLDYIVTELSMLLYIYIYS